MNVQALSNLFATTYDPNPNTRKAGELEIRKVSFHLLSNACTALKPNAHHHADWERGGNGDRGVANHRQ